MSEQETRQSSPAVRTQESSTNPKPGAPEASVRPAAVQDAYRKLLEEMEKVVIGQRGVMDLLLSALFAGGHCLLIGVPGLAKTMMVKTLAQLLDWQFRRIQFTPDLMPSDITGTEILQTDRDTGQRVLRFVPGPLFANIILADEINRTPPKTQAALLEAMQEYHITAAGKTMPLEAPFVVIATQNPIEQEGTYPLPEAQLDRFMYSLLIDYPGEASEEEIVTKTTGPWDATVAPVMRREALLDAMRLVREMPVSRHVVSYAVRLVRASRPVGPAPFDFIKKYVEWGAGPRAGQYLVLGAKAMALIRGKPAPSCADVRDVAHPVLQHRILVNYSGVGDGVTSRQLVNGLIERVKEPDYR